MANAGSFNQSGHGRTEVVVPHCRFTLHLPTNSRVSALACRQSRLAADKLILGFSRAYQGSTYSSTLHSHYTGFWLDAAANPNVTYLATVALLMIDVAVSFTDDHAVTQHMDAIRKFAFAMYAHEGVPQQEIWLAVSPVLIKLYV